MGGRQTWGGDLCPSEVLAEVPESVHSFRARGTRAADLKISGFIDCDDSMLRANNLSSWGFAARTECETARANSAMVTASNFN